MNKSRINIIKLFTLGIFYFQCQFVCDLNGQVVVTEHFTNTRCIICASRNPGFFNALRSNPDVIHIAYHPSSPYRDCLYSMQNPAENDARTRYYDVYGGTPTFIINGNLVSSNEVQNQNVFSQFKTKTSPLKLAVSILPDNRDSISVRVQIETVADHNFNQLSLYIPFVEDTVYYAAPNGEKTHYNVFRKSFTGTQSLTFTPPKKGEKPFVYSSKIFKNTIWDLKRMRAIAILSDMDKYTVHAEKSSLFNETLSNNSEFSDSNEKNIAYPNPVDDILFLKENSSSFQSYELFNLSGIPVLTGPINETVKQISVHEIPSGLYILKLQSSVSEIFQIIIRN